MRERLRELGGRLEVESDGSGTLIRAVIPISQSAEADNSGSAAWDRSGLWVPAGY